MDEIVDFYRFYNETNEQKLPILLLHGPAGCGKAQLVQSFCALRSWHLFKVFFKLKWLITLYKLKLDALKGQRCQLGWWFAGCSRKADRNSFPKLLVIWSVCNLHQICKAFIIISLSKLSFNLSEKLAVPFFIQISWSKPMQQTDFKHVFQDNRSFESELPQAQPERKIRELVLCCVYVRVKKRIGF